MTDIAAVFSAKPSGPYDKGLVVKVLQVGEEITYKGKDGSSKLVLIAAISDGKEVIKLVCYNADAFKHIKVGKTLMLRNIIKKTDEGRSVVLTSTSKVANWTPLPVPIPDHHLATADKIVRPPVAAIISVVDALASPPKQKVSVSGRIVQEEEKQTVKVRTEEVPIKNIYIEDKTGRAKITLWREASSTDARPRDFVEITDLLARTYQDCTSLSTTQRSIVKKTDAPVATTTVKVVGIAVADGNAELFIDQQGTSATLSEVIVPAELLQQAFTNGGKPDLFLDDACNDGPFNVAITRKGAEVMDIVLL